MSTERAKIINEIKNAINKRKEILLKIPLIHTLNDGIVIRFLMDGKIQNIQILNLLKLLILD